MATFFRPDSVVITVDDLNERHGSENPSKEKGRRRRNFIKEYLVDYTANSNLHGLRYIGEKERTFAEKLYWLVMFICCVLLCADLIRRVFIKWKDSPVIVSFDENSTPVWQIPFPAVTVCPEIKVMQTRYNYTKYLIQCYGSTSENLTKEERDRFEDVSMVCGELVYDSRKYSSGIETYRNINDASPNITDVLYTYRYADKFPRDSEFWTHILTEEGKCYTFNTVGAQDMFRLENLHKDYLYPDYLEKPTSSWTLEEGYAKDTPLKTYPLRGLGYGAKAGLSLLLQTKDSDLDHLCNGPEQSFKILLHNPAELPRPSQQYLRVHKSQELVVAVKPKTMTASDGLTLFEPERRQCYFQSERYLRYFKVYTQANCETECLTNFTFARCDCVHFGMPHGPNMAVCNTGRVACVQNAEMEILTIEVQSGLDTKASDNDTLGPAREVAKQCKCLPACTSIEYEAETSQADFNWKAIYRTLTLIYSFDNDIPEFTLSRVMVFFKGAQFINSRRSELYGLTDILASCGGLLGLFMGFSLLSLAEILYFLTLRICCRFRNRPAAKKHSPVFPNELTTKHDD